MSAKPSDRDEVALLMQQQGLSRVQATKLLYEMTKQRKKEEAAAAAAAARNGSKSPILETIQNDSSVVKQHIERYSSQKELVSAPSQIHLDVDFSTPRPTLRLDPEAAQQYKSVGHVSAAIESKHLNNISSSAKSSTTEVNNDDECEETVEPFDEDKFASEAELLAPVPMQVELSPTAVAATGTSPPARRRSSNSALDLRPLSRLHPTKFGKEGDEEGGDEEAEGHSVAGGGYGENGEGYCSGESSDGDGVFEEKERAGGGNMSAPGTASAPAAAIATFSPSSRAAAPAGTAATPVLVLTPPSAKVPPAAAAAPASITAPEPAAAPADRDDRLQDSAGTGTGGNSWSNNKTNNTNNLVPPKTGHYSYENENQHSDPDSSADGSLVVSASSSTFSSSATLTTSASATSSYESKTPFSSRTLTGRIQSQPLLPVQHLPLEEKVALINAGRYNNSSSNTAPSPAAVESTSDTSAAVLSPVGVTNVKVGNKKLTVRAGNSSSGGAAARTAGMGGSDPPPPAYDDLPPPPAYEDKTAAPAPAPIPAAAPAPAPAAPVMTARPVPTPPLPRTVPVAPFAAAPAAQVAPKRPAVPQLPGSISSSAGSLKEYSALTPVPEEVPSQSVSPAAVPMPPLPAAEEPHNRGDSPPEFEASDIDEREDDDEETKRRKFNRRSYIKKDNLPEAFKNLEPIDPLVLHELILREQEEKAVAAALQAQKLAASTTSSVPASGAAGSQPAARSVQQSSSSSSSSMAGATEVTSAVTTSSAGRQESAHPATANSTKEGTDLVEELMAQGYSRENAVTLAKEIEMDRRAERFRNSGAGGSGGSGGSGGGFNGAGPSSFPDSYSNSRAGPPRSGSSVVSHNSSSYNYGGATAYGRERASFDRSFNNEDDVGSVVSNISAFSRQSSVCENDKLLMNLLLSQQKGKFGVNMYESLTNSDEPAIERYVARGLTLDQAVLKVFENKYGAVDNQSMPRSMYGASSTNGSMVSSSKAPSSLNYDPSISAASADIVETMHAEIELLMLSGGYSRDVAVKMLLNKVAKEKAMQQNGTEPHTMHRAASMSNMPSSRGVVAAVESDVGYGYSGVGSRGGPQQAQGPPLQHGVGIGAGLGIGSGVGHAGADHHQLAQQQQHQHTLHSSRSMYAMPTAHTAGVSSGASVNGGGSVSSGRSSRSRPDPTGIPSHPPVHPAAPQQHYSQPSPSHIHAHPEAAFPTQYPQHSHSHSAGGPSSSGHNSHRRPSGSNISVASGKGSVASGASGITRLDSRDSDYIPNVLAQQEAAYGVNMYDYLAPDDPEVARLMGQFGFNKVDAMIAVFQQFPPQAAARSSGSRDGSRGGHPSGGIATNRYPGSSSSHGGLDNRQAPTIRRTAETAPKKAAPTYDEEAELERVLRLSMQEQQNTPGAVSMPGLGGGSGRNNGYGGPAVSAGPPGGRAGYAGGGGSGGGGGNGSSRQGSSNQDIMSLVGMGFTAAQAQAALARNNNDVHAAADFLLRGL